MNGTVLVMQKRIHFQTLYMPKMCLCSHTLTIKEAMQLTGAKKYLHCYFDCSCCVALLCCYVVFLLPSQVQHIIKMQIHNKCTTCTKLQLLYRVSVISCIDCHSRGQTSSCSNSQQAGTVMHTAKSLSLIDQFSVSLHVSSLSKAIRQNFAEDELFEMFCIPH